MTQSSAADGANRASSLGPTLFHAFVYVALGAVSFSTAYVATNTAAVWIPSGYAVGLIIVQGLRRWPAVMFGSFVLNILVIVTSHSDVTLGGSVAIAIPIAFGNAGEAVLGGYLTRRFACGPAFFARPRNVAAFALLVVPLAPLISMGIGVPASRLGGIGTSGGVFEVMLTWYVANAIGIMVFTAPAVVALMWRAPPNFSVDIGRIAEALILAACLILASQAICGVYLGDWLQGWPKTYMVTPLLFWASFRFGTYGALAAILIVTMVSVAGTMWGFAAFPADTPSRSLIYLQVFLGTISVMTLLVSAGLAENWDLQANLEDKVRARTQEVERYLREKDMFTTLVAHDLQSPIYGVRNALRAAVRAIRADRISPPEVASALVVMEETCSTLAERVASLLATATPGSVTTSTQHLVDVSTILRKIASAHRLSMDRKDAALRFSGNATLRAGNADKVEHILDILIDNAIKYSAPKSPVAVAVSIVGSDIEIRVTDRGPGVAPDAVSDLFLPRSRRVRNPDVPGVGLGLYLASEQANALGGTLTYAAAQPNGSTFRLVMPI